ncbi:hypothetical protein NFI96_006781 [Prochilodus magdalenae]|nr:hypothetical protein NFI96_006781 [Prochilodus magdalenae]
MDYREIDRICSYKKVYLIKWLLVDGRILLPGGSLSVSYFGRKCHIRVDSVKGLGAAYPEPLVAMPIDQHSEAPIPTLQHLDLVTFRPLHIKDITSCRSLTSLFPILNMAARMCAIPPKAGKLSSSSKLANIQQIFHR